MTEQQKSGYAYIQNTSKLLQNPNQNPQRDDLVQFSFENRREEILQLNEMEDDSLGSLSEVESQCNLKEKLHGSDEQFDTSPVQTKSNQLGSYLNLMKMDKGHKSQQNPIEQYKQQQYITQNNSLNNQTKFKLDMQTPKFSQQNQSDISRYQKNSRQYQSSQPPITQKFKLRKKTFKLFDPITKNLMLSIRNPQIPIKPLDSSSTIIDLEKVFDYQQNQKEQKPKDEIYDFLNLEQLDFIDKKSGWELLTQIIKPKNQQQRFWMLVEKLQAVKEQYNKALQRQKELIRKKKKGNQSSLNQQNLSQESQKPIKNNQYMKAVNKSQVKTSNEVNLKNPKKNLSSLSISNKVQFQDKVDLVTFKFDDSSNKLEKQFQEDQLNFSRHANNQNERKTSDKLYTEQDQEKDFISPKLEQMKSVVKNLRRMSTKFDQDMKFIKKELYKSPQQQPTRRTSTLLTLDQLALSEQYQSAANTPRSHNLVIKKAGTFRIKPTKKPFSNIINHQDLEKLLRESLEASQSIIKTKTYKIGFMQQSNKQEELENIVDKLTSDLKKKTQEILVENQNLMIMKSKTMTLASRRRTQRPVIQITDTIESIRTEDQDERSEKKSLEQSLQLNQKQRLSMKRESDIQVKRQYSPIDPQKQEHSLSTKKIKRNAINLKAKHIQKDQRLSISIPLNRTSIESKISPTFSQDPTAENTTFRIRSMINIKTKIKATTTRKQARNNYAEGIQKFALNPDNQISLFKLRYEKARQKNKDKPFQSQLRSYNMSPFIQNYSSQINSKEQLESFQRNIISDRSLQSQNYNEASRFNTVNSMRPFHSQIQGRDFNISNISQTNFNSSQIQIQSQNLQQNQQKYSQSITPAEQLSSNFQSLSPLSMRIIKKIQNRQKNRSFVNFQQNQTVLDKSLNQELNLISLYSKDKQLRNLTKKLQHQQLVQINQIQAFDSKQKDLSFPLNQIRQKEINLDNLLQHQTQPKRTLNQSQISTRYDKIIGQNSYLSLISRYIPILSNNQ